MGNSIHNVVEIPYSEIDGFPLSTVVSHCGNLLFGELAGKSVVAMSGRFHFYEGYDFRKATCPVRVLKESGISVLILSNASGALNPAFRKGDLMLLNDHINLLPGNPLIGPNEERWGPRFPDMSHPYDKQLAAHAECAALGLNIRLHKGVYASVPGPNLETRAEYRFLRTIGADAVGMSTVPEVITAHHMGIRCLAVSVITDECDPDNLHPVSLQEIIAAATAAEPALNRLLTKVIEKI
jgi:purine-nucleoside phosphorylase